MDGRDDDNSLQPIVPPSRKGGTDNNTQSNAPAMNPPPPPAQNHVTIVTQQQRETMSALLPASSSSNNNSNHPYYYNAADDTFYDGGETPHHSYHEFDFYTSASSTTLRHVQRVSKRAALASKKVIWDSNDNAIDAAQSAVDQWEDAYNALRGLLVASVGSAQRLYDAAKIGVMGLEHGILCPVRDFILMPAFNGVEKIASDTIGFLQSDQAARVAEQSLQLTRQVPVVGPSLLAPALVKSAEIVQVAWEIVQYPIPKRHQVRDAVDWCLTGTKLGLSTAGREIFLYMTRADATITRTLSHTQWKVLGSGPYATLDKLNKQEVIDHLCERYFSLTESSVARYELAAHIRAHNLPLYGDLVGTGLLKDRGGELTKDDEWLSPCPSYRLDSAPFLIPCHGDGNISRNEDDDDNVSALWFRLPYLNGEKPGRDVPWVRFTGRDRRRLEHKYRRILRQDTAGKQNVPTRSKFAAAEEEELHPRDEIEPEELSTSHSTFFDMASLQSPSAGTCSDEAQVDKEQGCEGSCHDEGREDPRPQDENDNSHSTQDLNEALHVSSGYPTVAQWYIPDLENDVLVDQKRHSVSFFYGCPKCRRRHDDASPLHPPLRPKQLGDLCDDCIGESSQHDVVTTTWMASSSAVLSPPPLTMVMRPNLWRFHGPGDEIRRAVWFLDTRRHGLQPYGDEAQAVLEDAFWFLKWRSCQLQSAPKRTKKSEEDSTDDEDEEDEADPMGGHALLTVQVPSPDGSELQLVQFSSLTQATVSNKGLGGAISLFKRRVFRGVSLPVEESVECAGNEISDEDSKIQHLEPVDDAESLAAPATMFDAAEQVISSTCYPGQEDINDEADDVEHLVLIVHGIGEMLRCSVDLVFGLQIPNLSSIIDCCGFLRKNHVEIQNARFSQVYATTESTSASTMGRCEYLPVEWHEAFSIASQRMSTPTAAGSSQSSNVMMQDISLRTVPQMRSFANDTVLDVLYFMSAEHHDIIIDIVSKEMNAVVQKFRALTGFKGKVSIIGHSLGSIITWDILGNQDPPDSWEPSSSLPGARRCDSNGDWEDILPSSGRLRRNSSSSLEDEGYRTPPTTHCSLYGRTWSSQRKLREHEQDGVSAVTAAYAYPKLAFDVDHAFFLGSPIAVFLMVRNQRKPLNTDFSLNGCPRVFNIFHPFDPVAYRIEPLLDPRNADFEPKLMTHWNGGFRVQYQTKRLWRKLVQSTMRTSTSLLEAFEAGIAGMGLLDHPGDDTVESEADESETEPGYPYDQDRPVHVVTGKLNQGRRIDYVLQEKEIETANEYVSALAAHSCYWVEKDLSLFVARQLYLSRLAAEHEQAKRSDDLDVLSRNE